MNRLNVMIRIVQKRLPEEGVMGWERVDGVEVEGVDGGWAWGWAELETMSDVDSWNSVVSARMSINEFLGRFMWGSGGVCKVTEFNFF
jgi:hypothetical protein